MSTTVSNTDDVIDSRDVIERLGSLAGQWAGWSNNDGSEKLTDEETAELESLSRLASEASDYSEDWEYGATLIRDSYFVAYTQGLAEEMDLLPQRSWPLNCIDWEGAARELRMDYTSVDFDGVTYWVR